MKITKKIESGQPGTKKWVRKYGKKLICVRYRDDNCNHLRLKTVEIIVESKPLNLNKENIPANKILPIRIGYLEKNLRVLIKKAGEKWNSLQKVWELPYQEICSLGLEKRIVRNMPIYRNKRKKHPP